MSISYSRDQRDFAKKRKMGLVTIGWQDKDGKYHTSQGPATDKMVAQTRKFLDRAIKNGEM